ncbi:hypothetical protein ACHAP3_009244 [Botrytis cinerea]
MADAPDVIYDEARAIAKIYYDTTGQLLSLSERSRYTLGWTSLAKKYGRPLGRFASVDHRILGNEAKSGVTPREDYSKSHRSRRRGNWKESSYELETYQRKRFNGFTTFDLHTMKCLAALDTDVSLYNLRNPIHPCFEESKWVTENDMPKHKGAIPILGDEIGFWMADNPVVWTLLKPCLQLATMMLHNECKYSWLDALLNGTYEDVPESIKGIKLQRFFSRTHSEKISRSSPRILENSIQNMTSKVVFGFHSGYEEVTTGLPRSRTSRNAITRNHTIFDRFEVLVSTEMAQPLLRNDLTDAEKMGNRLRIATTLVHEFAHAIRRSIINERDDSDYKAAEGENEPYFEDEPLAELGYSFIENLSLPLLRENSNTNSMYNRGGPGLPNLGIIKTSWFTDKNKAYQTSRKAPPLNRKPKRGQIDNFHTYDYWPVPTQWYSFLFSEGFWENVREFGPEAKKIRTDKRGMRYLSKDHPDAKSQIDDSGIRIGSGWPYGIRQTRSQIKRFIVANNVSTRISKQHGFEEGSPDPLDHFNIKPPKVTYLCPRWNEITEHLFSNRGPLKLALDTMGLLSEPTFFRYIRDHSGINLTSLEFRNFLGVADEKRELFLWEPFPGFGIVKRIATGWPLISELDSISWPSPIGEPDEDDMETLDNLMSDEAVQAALYEYCGECRDLDIETFRLWLVDRFEMEEFDGEDADEEFRDVIWETVQQGGAYFT